MLSILVLRPLEKLRCDPEGRTKLPGVPGYPVFWYHRPGNRSGVGALTETPKLLGSYDNIALVTQAMDNRFTERETEVAVETGTWKARWGASIGFPRVGGQKHILRVRT